MGLLCLPFKNIQASSFWILAPNYSGHYSGAELWAYRLHTLRVGFCESGVHKTYAVLHVCV